MLRQVPGVEVRQSGSAGQSDRGFDSRLNLGANADHVDGVPSTPGDRWLRYGRVTTDDLDRIEVVRGAGGALYGSQAIGGVVNLITQEGSARSSSATSGGRKSRDPTPGGGFQWRGGEARILGCGVVFFDQRVSPRNESSDNLSGALRLDYHLGPNTTIQRLRALHAVEREPGQLLQFLRRSIRTRISATSSCCTKARSSTNSASD